MPFVVTINIHTRYPRLKVTTLRNTYLQERELNRICVHVGRYGSITNYAIIIDLKLTALQVYSMVMRHEPSQTVHVSNAGNVW